VGRSPPGVLKDVDMGFVTIGQGYGSTMAVDVEFYNTRREAAHTTWLESDGEPCEWHGYGYLEFESDLYEEMMQKLIDQAEA
jgi:hypothetical protein